MEYTIGVRAAKMAALGAVAALLAWPAAAQGPGLAMLNTLEKGAWTLRPRDNGPQQRLCVRNGREFIQLAHRQPGCNPVVVEDQPGQVVVQYACRGSGFGRTSIRRESRGLVQIDSRGVAGGTPFALSAEARHSGSC